MFNQLWTLKLVALVSWNDETVIANRKWYVAMVNEGTKNEKKLFSHLILLAPATERDRVIIWFRSIVGYRGKRWELLSFKRLPETEQKNILATQTPTIWAAVGHRWESHKTWRWVCFVIKYFHKCFLLDGAVLWASANRDEVCLLESHPESKMIPGWNKNFIIKNRLVFVCKKQCHLTENIKQRA